ncbi:bestrophin-4 isoform X2 [Halyomorpha halys]|uniref:bestrophin-4 isoform X2 n=1 Tax=Halyomorpha halys TaxID=286706 RepID=UPI000D0C877F|nr:bestrophin-2-like isoform X2 [Halyomorpha halys]
MTVSYQYEVASSTSGGFTRLLFLWRGSLYKLIYRELILFLIAFGILSALYRNAFTIEQKRLFEKVVIYCDTFINLIPLSFVLGFYVAYVAGRWWQQFMAIPWPDKVMHSLALYVGSNDEQGRILRRTMMRYLNLSLILVLRSISSAVKRRFPTMEHLIEAGFMTRIELEMFTAVPSLEFNTYWIPCTWFISLLKDARKGNKITDPQGLKLIMQEFNEFRSKCGLLWSYDWISIPLVYTQVAEQLINPFGDDDEDFELNWLIDRHTKVSYLGVDTLMVKTPPLVKDKYFDDLNLVLPYTGAAVAYKKKTYRGSVHNMMVPEDQQSMFLPDITEEEEVEQRSTPKASFSNLFNHSASSGPAGIWRPSTDNIDIECMADPDEIGTAAQEHHGSKIKHFFRKAPRVPTPIVRDKPFNFNIPETQQWHHWSSNSTIDSYCSTANAAIDSVSEKPEIDGAITDHEEIDKKTKKKEVLGNESPMILSTEHLMNNLGIRRMSTSSGQWKGVRWKPVLCDSPRDSWSDSYPIRKIDKAVETTHQSCSNCQVEDDKRQNMDPFSRKMDEIRRSTRSQGGYECDQIKTNFTQRKSLPNLHLNTSFVITDSTWHEEDKNETENHQV